MKPDRTEIKDVQTLRKNSMTIAFAALFSILAIPSSAPGADTVRWDFTQGTLGWRANQQVADLASTEAGLRFRSTGNDPWIEGPPVDLGATRMARVRIRMRSDVDTAGELFYGRQFTAGKSVRFAVYPDGKWHEYELTIGDQLGPRTRFRLDPCTREGQVNVAWIEVEAIEQIGPPPLPMPQRPTENDTTPIRIAAQNVEVVHYGGKWGSFLVLVDGVEMAAGHNAETIGYLDDDGPQWLSMADAEVQTKVQQNERIEVQAVLGDRGGATWHFKRTFRTSKINDAITVETEVAVDKDRKAILVPWLTLLPGLGTYGQNKDQGLFAGLEYLSNEPSSSRADIETS